VAVQHRLALDLWNLHTILGSFHFFNS
jgi:hypothetical protein